MTDDGDIDFTDNTFSLVNGQDEIRQRALQNLRTFLGEWFLDLSIGVPYIQLIFQKGTPPNLIDALFKSEILLVKGVTGLKKFDPLDLDPATRSLTVNFEATTTEGDVAILEVFP